MGFYSDDLPIDTLDNLEEKLLKRPKAFRYIIRDQSLEKYDRVKSMLPELRTSVSQYLSFVMAKTTGDSLIFGLVRYSF